MRQSDKDSAGAIIRRKQEEDKEIITLSLLDVSFVLCSLTSSGGRNIKIQLFCKMSPLIVELKHVQRSFISVEINFIADFGQRENNSRRCVPETIVQESKCFPECAWVNKTYTRKCDGKRDRLLLTASLAWC
jgi:hypothetical protein